ncbi:MAG: hypothetical protein DRP82_04525 [Planctomycetota bacterium]|nr:MAG: hypothetical protein DRP82_04525 [Planctomycetota bacterium]
MRAQDKRTPTRRLRDALGYISLVNTALHLACSKLERDVLLRFILDIMIDALGHPVDVAALFTRANSDLTLVAWRGQIEPPTHAPDSVLPLLRSQTPQDLPASACLPGLEEGSKALVVPFRVEGEVVGFACFYPAASSDMDDIQSEVMSALSAVCAVSIRMMSLYEELARRLEEVEEAHRRLIEQERLAAINLLLASLTHEIKNPLASAYSLVQLLQEGMEATPDTLERISRGLKRAKDLVERLLKYSKPSKPRKVVVEAKELLEEPASLVESECRSRKIKLVRRYQENIYVLANKRQMSDVFMNLMMNAIDAMPQGGTLTVAAEAAPEGMVCFRICDTGCGIPEDKLPHIFEPFFTTKKKGTGLGLYNCYNTTKQHNGRVEVDSKVGEGTEFRIYLPAAEGKKR